MATEVGDAATPESWPKLLADLFPVIAAELTEALLARGETDLAGLVPNLHVSRCEYDRTSAGLRFVTRLEPTNALRMISLAPSHRRKLWLWLRDDEPVGLGIHDAGSLRPDLRRYGVRITGPSSGLPWLPAPENGST